MMAANAILLIMILLTGLLRKGGQAKINLESENTRVINPDVLSPEVANSGMNNFWVRGSWAGCPRPVIQETRSGAADIVLPFLSMAFAIISILSEGFRLFMVPAYLLAVILLLHGIVKAILKKPGAHEAASSADKAVSSLTVRSKRHLSRISGIFGTVTLVLIFAISVASAFLFTVVDLPEPSGPYPVGTALAAFTDASRKEPHKASGECRKIPVQIWYPASDTAGKKRANWLSSEKNERNIRKVQHVPDILGLRDERFKAFINMDGSPFGTAVDNVIRQPFMILTVGKI
jgi:hypothetical protein